LAVHAVALAARSADRAAGCALELNHETQRGDLPLPSSISSLPPVISSKPSCWRQSLAALVDVPDRTVSPIRSVPLVGMPMIIWNSVVLPAPLGPSRRRSARGSVSRGCRQQVAP
jgi:hypothetical protein